MYPKIKAVGDFDPKYANLLEPAIRNNIKPGTIYIERVGVWWCVFRKKEEGMLRRGNYKALFDAVAAARN